MFDLMFERKRKQYCQAYLLPEKKWLGARRTNVLIFSLIAFFLVKIYFGLPLIESGLIALAIGLLLRLFFYNQLVNYDKVIYKKLEQDFPLFVITFASLMSSYDNVINVFIMMEEYTSNEYYEKLLKQLNKLNREYPNDINNNIFKFAQEIPSSNAMFFAKTAVDIKEKGYDPKLLDTLINNVSIENQNLAENIVANASNSYIKFGTLPIMFSMMYLFYFVIMQMSTIMGG